VILYRGLVDLRPLRSSADFRRLWLANLLSAMGSQMTLFAVLFQVWELTGSTVWVGAIGLAKAVPMVVVGQVAGSLADAVDRRLLVIVSTIGQVITSGALAIQAFTDLRVVWLVLLLVAFAASFGALGAPARRTLTVRLLSRDEVAAGVALNHLSFQTSILVGPALAGVVTSTMGIAACYVIDAITFVAALYAAITLPAVRPESNGTRPGPRAIMEGWRYIAKERVLRGALLTDALATFLAMPIALFPAINDQRFGGDPETLGLFLSAIAVGGIAAGALSGIATRASRPGAVMLAGAGLWGIALTGFGLANALWLTLACLSVAGAADTVSVISRGSIVQLATPDGQRGRVSAAEHMIGVSGPDLGSFRAGLLAGATSATFAAVAGGAMCALGIAFLAASNKPLRTFTLERPRHP
jgi:MFS family permease